MINEHSSCDSSSNRFPQHYAQISRKARRAACHGVQSIRWQTGAMRTLTLNHDYSDDLTTLLAKLADVAVWEPLASEASAEHIAPATEMTLPTPMPRTELPTPLPGRVPPATELAERY